MSYRKYINRARMLEGCNLFVYGHSYSTVPVVNSINATSSWQIGSTGRYQEGGGEWPQRLLSRLGMNPTALWGVSGSKMPDIAYGMTGTVYPGANGAKALVAGTWSGLMVIEGTTNDILNNAVAGDANYLKGFKHALRSILARIEAVSLQGGQIIETSTGSVDLAGNWTSPAASLYSGGSARSTTVQNAWWQAANINTNGADHIWLALWAWDSGSSLGQFKIEVDSVDVTSTALTMLPNYGLGESKTYAGLGTNYSFSPCVIKLPISGAGTHTVRVTKTDATTNPVYIDAIYVPGTRPMPTIICKDPHITSASNSGVSGKTYNQAWTDYAASYMAAVDSVVGEFSFASAVDLDRNWDNSVHIASKDAASLHPNDAGMSVITDNIVSEVMRRGLTIATPGMSVL